MDGSDSYELGRSAGDGGGSHPDRGTPFDEVNREYTGEKKSGKPHPASA